MREVVGILKPYMSETKHETSFQKWPAKTEPKTLNPVACPKAHTAAVGYLRALQTSTPPSPPSEIDVYQPDILKRPGQIFLSRYATYLKQNSPRTAYPRLTQDLSGKRLVQPQPGIRPSVVSTLQNLFGSRSALWIVRPLVS